MSIFELAIPTILKHEGGFVYNKNDPGGATNFGISLRWLKSHGKLDLDLDHDGDLDINDIRQMTSSDACSIYRKEWWDKYGYGRINDQTLATKVFDLSVNMGSKQAHKLTQRAVWAIKGSRLLQDDGILGNASIALINSGNSLALLSALRSEAGEFYRGLVHANNNYKEFLEGWLNRAYA